MTEQPNHQSETENSLDRFFTIEGIEPDTNSPDALSRKRYRVHFQPDQFPEGAYKDFGEFSHLSNTHQPEEAAKHAQNFKTQMGFSVEALLSMARELEDLANKK